MSDDLQKMLNTALDTVAQRDSAEKAAKQKREEDIKASGAQLKARVMPRLLEAQKAWEGKLKLNIKDNSDKYSIGIHGTGSYPNIEVHAVGKEFAGYIITTHSPGYVSIQEGGGNRRGSTAYSFQVDKIEQLTDPKIDEILQAIVNEAMGLTNRR